MVHAHLENYYDAFQDFNKTNSIDVSLKANTHAENILNVTQNLHKSIKNQVF